eukprot:TRINITY_DN12124_c0_g2_i2.p1 TRINITY_DN12124_c0_g2~~TRINITY_DN12124_c0_g2_i2.p1  ORF type:complete len:116 (-),score=12.45 TRINITY_DN12124_c0_g2_i2:402-749(-)
MDTFFMNVKLGWVPIDGYILDECQIGLGAKLQGGAGVLGSQVGPIWTLAHLSPIIDLPHEDQVHVFVKFLRLHSLFVINWKALEKERQMKFFCFIIIITSNNTTCIIIHGVQVHY